MKKMTNERMKNENGNIKKIWTEKRKNNDKRLNEKRKYVDKRKKMTNERKKDKNGKIEKTNGKKMKRNDYMRTEKI